MDLEKIRARLRKAREDAGLSREQVGAVVGVTGKAVYYWETGRRDISLPILDLLGKALNRDPMWFLMEDPDGPSPPDLALAIRTLERVATAAQQGLAALRGPRPTNGTLARPGEPSGPEDELAARRGDRERRVEDLAAEIRQRLAASTRPGGQVTVSDLAEAARLAAEVYVDREDRGES